MDNRPAPELRSEQWIDSSGSECAPVRLGQFPGKIKILFCFQSWCQGCHDTGFPSLKLLVDGLTGDDRFVFLAIQTVFEGEEENSYEKLRSWQTLYGLEIPFGHDPGDGVSTLMEDYDSGGTPWFIFIDHEERILFADFRFNVEAALKLFRGMTKNGGG